MSTGKRIRIRLTVGRIAMTLTMIVCCMGQWERLGDMHWVRVGMSIITYLVLRMPLCKIIDASKELEEIERLAGEEDHGEEE